MLDQSILDELKGRRCLVTGGAGMIGQQVVRLLREAGAPVTIVDLRAPPKDLHVPYVQHDLSSLHDLTFMMRKMDYVFHLAGGKGSPKATTEKPADYFVPLLMATTNVLEAARLAEVNRLVYTSSIGAYSKSAFDGPIEEDLDDEWYRTATFAPMDTYPGWAKRMGELQIRAYQIQYGMTNFVPVRLTSCYGPGDNFGSPDSMVVTSVLGRLARGEREIKLWDNGEAVRDWLYSQDAAEGIVLAAVKGVGPQFYNLGTGKGETVRNMVTLAMGLPGAQAYRLTYVDSSPSIPSRVLDITRARTELGFNPTTVLGQGLRETWEWLQK